MFYTCQITWQEEALQHVTLHRPHGWSAGRLGPRGWCSASSALLKIEAQHECCFRATWAKSCTLLLPPPSYNEIYFVILFYYFFLFWLKVLFNVFKYFCKVLYLPYYSTPTLSTTKYSKLFFFSFNQFLFLYPLQFWR